LVDTRSNDSKVFSAALHELAKVDKSNVAVALRHLISVDAGLMQVGRVSYWELTPDHSAIQCRLLFQLDGQTFAEGGELRADDFPSYFAAMLDSRRIVANDAWIDPRTREFAEPYFKPNNIRAMLDVPVWRRGALAGVLCHEHVGDHPRTWTAAEQDFAVGIANMISVALEAGARRRAEEGYALIAQATNDVLWDWDLTRDVVEWNEALSRVFGHHAIEVSPSVTWWIDHVHPEDRVRVKKSIMTVIELGGRSWTDQYRFLRGDDTYATVIDRGTVVRNDKGVAVRMVGSMLDITERVQLQERLALSDRMASIGTLAAGVAHEINNPLTYIKANLMCAIDDLRSGSVNVENLLGLLREAQEGAERVRRVVRDLQTFSRPREDELETLEVRSVIESSINMAWNEIRHRAQLIKDYGPMPRVRMNRARLGQVILNLLVNAAQAIQVGDADTNRIHIRTSTSPLGEAVIEIRDTGGGIPPAALGRIFEPFFTTKPVGVGTGLGLSICHSIVTAAGGRIDISSPPSGGCSVTVVVPANEPAADATVIVRAAPPSPRRRVLLVDDEAPIRRALHRMLERAHDVFVADSGESALAELLANGQRYDVILCDLMMPHMSGMQVYDRLAGEYAELTRRFIFMTGGAFSKRSSEFLAECDRPVLDKPFDMDTLSRAVAQVTAA
jgi:PAS domain S-box-containing protein